MVTSPSVFTFVELDVNLNTLLPTLHLGFASTVGVGKAKTPVAVPAAFVVKAAPALEPVGVTYVDTSTPSKKGKILVPGFIPLAVNVISFALMNVAKATCTTLLPILVFLNPPGTNCVLIPVLVRVLTSCVSIVVLVTVFVW